jgi:hypothetical protein
MTSMRSTAPRRLVGLIALTVALLIGPRPLLGADHHDAPQTEDDPAVDLADLYAWTTDAGTLVVVLTFAPGLLPGADPVLDPDVLYSIHFARVPELPEDLVIRTRFGENLQTGQWGVQIRHLPGAGTDLVGPVGMTLQGPGLARAFVDLVDDPFFADLDGLDDSIASQSLQFDETRDAMAGQNVMAIVLEMDRDLVLVDDDPIYVWATAGRAP